MLKGFKMSWDWDNVFQKFVQKCEEQGGGYCMSIGEGSEFKDGKIGIGWGEGNLRNKIIPRYKRKYPGYIFSIADRKEPRDRYYLCCVRAAEST